MLRVVFRSPPPWEDRIKQDGFEFIDRVNKTSRAIFTVDNYDYKYSDIKGFQKNFTFCFGEWGVMSKWFKTDIVSVEGSHELRIEAHTMETRLMTKPQKRFYEETTLKGVLDVIASCYGLVPAYDPDVEGLAIASLSQVGETDAQFLKRLATTHGYHFWIDGDSLCFKSEGSSAIKTLPFGELMEEPDFKYDFRKSRKKPKVKGAKSDAVEQDDDFDLEEFVQEFGDYDGPQSTGKFSPVTDKEDASSGPTVKLNSDLTYTAIEAQGTKPKDGPMHEADEIVARSKSEAVALAAKKIMKMTIKLPANVLIFAGDSIDLVQAPAGIEGQWYVREHKYKWPVSTYELSRRGFKKKVEKEKLPASKEIVTEATYAEVAQLASLNREPNTSIDPLLFGASMGIGLKPKGTVVLNNDLSYEVAD